jgi:hypothetical protein
MDFDTRFIPTQSNNTQLNTWANRGSSALNLTGDTNVRYFTDVQAGQPAVRHTAAGALLEVASVNLFSTYGYSSNAVAITATRDLKGSGTERRLFAYGSAGGNNSWGLWAQYSDNNMYLDYADESGGRVSGAVSTLASPAIITATVNSSSGTVTRNGTSVLSGFRSGSLSAVSQTFRLGNDNLVSTLATYQGDFYAHVNAPGLTAPVIKRIEHSIAFSFKIACS